MSFGNYFGDIDGVNTFYQPHIALLGSPPDGRFAVRAGDVLDEVGNATYPLNSSQIVSGASQDVILFSNKNSNDYKEADFLHIQPLTSKELNNKLRLMDLIYSLKIDGHNITDFEAFVVLTDASLNVVKTEATSFSWAAGGGANPPTLSGLTARGYSIQVPDNAVYAFLKIKTDTNTSGSITFKPYLIHSELKMATSNNTKPDLVGDETRSPLNQIYWETDTVFNDTAGVAAEVKDLEQSVASLQADYVSKSNNTTQETNSSFIFKGAQNSYKFPNNQGLRVVDVKSYVPESTDYNIITSFKGAGLLGFNTGNTADLLYLKTVDDNGDEHKVQINELGGIETEEKIVVPADKGFEFNDTDLGLIYKLSYLKSSASRSDPDALEMLVGGNQKLTFVGQEQTNPIITFNLKEADENNQNIDMNSHPIINVASPINDADCATKHYVDTHTGGNYLSTTKTEPQSLVSPMTFASGANYFKIPNNQGIIATDVNSYIGNGATYNIISSYKGAGIKGRKASSTNPRDELILQSMNDDGTARQVKVDSNGSVLAPGRFQTESSAGYYLVKDGASFSKWFESAGNTYFTSGQADDPQRILFRPTSGGSQIMFDMKGKLIDLDGDYRIQNMADPVNPPDAATKNYVDNAVASGGGSGGGLPLIHTETINSFGGQADTFQYGVDDFAFKEGKVYKITVNIGISWNSSFNINDYDLKGLQAHFGFHLPGSGVDYNGPIIQTSLPDFIRGDNAQHLTAYFVEHTFDYVAPGDGNYKFTYAWTLNGSTNWKTAWLQWQGSPYGNNMAISAYEQAQYFQPTP